MGQEEGVVQEICGTINSMFPESTQRAMPWHPKEPRHGAGGRCGAGNMRNYKQHVSGKHTAPCRGDLRSRDMGQEEGVL